jgi:hypothetical protein
LEGALKQLKEGVKTSVRKSRDACNLLEGKVTKLLINVLLANEVGQYMYQGYLFLLFAF